MKINSLIFLLVLSVSFVQAQVLVSYNKSDNVDFSSYKTYQMKDVEVTDIPEFEAKKEGLDLLTAEINKQMQARGYEKVNENPNLIINLGVIIAGLLVNWLSSSKPDLIIGTIVFALVIQGAFRIIKLSK